MNKVLPLVVAVLAVVVAGYFLLRTDATNSNQELSTPYATYSSSELGITFNYPSGPDGYVLQERTSTDTKEGLVRVLILMQAEDASREMPIGGEGTPVIAVSVFDNTTKQWPQAWADSHLAYSNINLKIGEALETVVGGANAIRYRADGLYASETAVVAHGDSIYVITGQFLDENSDMRRDVEPLLDSVRFIPKAGQE